MTTKITASTNMDIQRITFVESLYSSLKKQAEKAVEEHQKYVTKASTYIEDGLSDEECIEMLIIDGLTRKAAEAYFDLARTGGSDSQEGLYEYSFQFEDIYGKVWSSHDIGKTVRASTDEDAWLMVEEVLAGDAELEADKVLGINRIS